MDTVDVQVARLQEQMKAVHADVADIRVDQKTQNGKLDLLLANHNRRQGAATLVKVLLAVGSSSGLMALLARVFHL